MKWRPYGTRVLVKRDETERVTGGGLHIPSAHRKPSVNATVLDVGGSPDIPDVIKPGVGVILNGKHVREMEIDGKACTLVDYAMGHILVVVE